MRVGEELSPDEVVKATTSGKGRMSFVDTLGVCFFSTIGNVELLAAALSAVSGWDFDANEAEAVGLRIVNLARVYNYRVGHTRAHEFPSPRYGSTPTNGPLVGKSMMQAWDQLLDTYYEKMGWDVKTGKPLPETLTRLGLDDTIKDIW
jgi:aldehyde:ferredoxin oxidoreductase